MEDPKIDLEKEYLLLHKILEALRFAGMSFESTGSIDGGFVPLNEIQLGTARMHFGTLTDYVNDPARYQKPLFAGQLITTIRKVDEKNQDRYTLKDVSQAIDTLTFRDMVEKVTFSQ